MSKEMFALNVLEQMALCQQEYRFFCLFEIVFYLCSIVGFVSTAWNAVMIALPSLWAQVCTGF